MKTKPLTALLMKPINKLRLYIYRLFLRKPKGTAITITTETGTYTKDRTVQVNGSYYLTRFPLILIFLLATLGVMGQTIPATSSVNGKLLIGSSILVSSGFIINGSLNKAWFSIQGKPTWNNPDSLIIYVKKSQLRWINDSTAVITK